MPNGGEIIILLLGLALFLAVNFVTYFLFRLDKQRARMGEWRIPESAMLYFALLGGWFGAKYAQRSLRHKTRKVPFRHVLNAIPVIWVLCLGALWNAL